MKICSIGLLLLLGPAGCDDPTNSPPPESQKTGISTPPALSTVSRADLESSLEAAEKYFSTGELDKAEAILDLLIRKAPQSGRAWEQYGMVHLAAALVARQQGDLIGAEDRNQQAHLAYQEAVALDPTSGNGGLLQSAGEVAHLTGHPDLALDCYLRAAKLDPTNPRPPLYAAQVYLARQQYAPAEDLLRRVIDIDGELAIAHASLALVQLENGDELQALTSIERARQLDPDDLGIRSRHALILRRTGNPRRAVELLIALPSPVRAQEHITAEIAAGYEQLDEPRLAARAWAHSFNTNHPLKGAWRMAVRIGKLLLQSGDFEEAKLWLDEANLLAPEAGEVREFDALFQKTVPPPPIPTSP